MRLGVVVPTITGREESLARTREAYRETLEGVDHMVYTPKDHPNWPTACNEGSRYFLDLGVDVIHYGADDLVPVGDWLSPCLPVLDAGELPAPRVWNFVIDTNEAHSQEIDGGNGMVTRFTRVPILTRRMVEAIGPWPEIVYYSDVWVSVKAQWLGMVTRVTAGYDFIHYWEQIGRLADEGEAAYHEFERLCEQFARPPTAEEVLA